MTSPLRILALVAAMAPAAALAQDYNDWSTISPYGLEMVDPYGNVHYVDPYAYDSQVDIYGNVISSYNGGLGTNLGYMDLTPYNGGYDNSAVSPVPDVNPYAGATDLHGKFLEMIWE